jgi:hypothetical protein
MLRAGDFRAHRHHIGQGTLPFLGCPEISFFARVADFALVAVAFCFILSPAAWHQCGGSFLRRCQVRSDCLSALAFNPCVLSLLDSPLLSQAIVVPVSSGSNPSDRVRVQVCFPSLAAVATAERTRPAICCGVVLRCGLVLARLSENLPAAASPFDCSRCSAPLRRRFAAAANHKNAVLAPTRLGAPSPLSETWLKIRNIYPRGAAVSDC